MFAILEFMNIIFPYEMRRKKGWERDGKILVVSGIPYGPHYIVAGCLASVAAWCAPKRPRSEIFSVMRGDQKEGISEMLAWGLVKPEYTACLFDMKFTDWMNLREQANTYSPASITFVGADQFGPMQKAQALAREGIR